MHGPRAFLQQSIGAAASASLQLTHGSKATALPFTLVVQVPATYKHQVQH